MRWLCDRKPWRDPIRDGRLRPWLLLSWSRLQQRHAGEPPEKLLAEKNGELCDWDFLYLRRALWRWPGRASFMQRSRCARSGWAARVGAAAGTGTPWL